jgi:hypothetical protein
MNEKRQSETIKHYNYIPIIAPPVNPVAGVKYAITMFDCSVKIDDDGSIK